MITQCNFKIDTDGSLICSLQLIPADRAILGTWNTYLCVGEGNCIMYQTYLNTRPKTEVK